MTKGLTHCCDAYENSTYSDCHFAPVVRPAPGVDGGASSYNQQNSGPPRDSLQVAACSHPRRRLESGDPGWVDGGVVHRVGGGVDFLNSNQNISPR